MSRRGGSVLAGFVLTLACAAVAGLFYVAVVLAMTNLSDPAPGQPCDAVADTVSPRGDLVCALDYSGSDYRWRAR